MEILLVHCPNDDNALWIDDRLVLTPHSAFYSPAAMEDLRTNGIETALAFLAEGQPRNAVNEERLGSLRRPAAEGCRA